MEPDFFIDVVLCMERQEPMQATSDPLEFWKEIAHEGKFVRDTGRSRAEINITRALMDHWKSTFDDMSGESMTVPVPIEHTRDPEKRRATVMEMARKPNKRGQSALYARVRFRDEEAAKLAKTSNASIFVPKKITSGTTHRDFLNPIEHVAITDYPVIHDLEPFEAISLSLTEEMEMDMTLRELATQAGVDPSITDEQQILMALSQVIMRAKGPPQAPPGAPPGPPAPPRPMAPPRFAASKAEPLTGTLLKIVRDGRKMKLDALSGGDRPKITPAARKKLEEKYLTDEAIQFSHVPEADDGFDALIETLELNEPIMVKSGRSGVQAAIALSKGDDSNTDNALTRDMDRRAESANKGMHRTHL